MTTRIRTRALGALSLVITLAGCSAMEATELAWTRYGDAVRVGNGEARSYIRLVGGVPTELGVELDSAALEGLPGPKQPHRPMTAGHEDMHEFLVPMPSNNPTPYRFLELDWNPAGHHPDPIYGKPHFDFHFYTIDVEDRNAIDPSDSAWTRKMNAFPAPAFIPAGYTYAGEPVGAPVSDATVPRMGVHWTSLSSPELQPVKPAPFTHTFIVGTWDGRVIFHEPMITRETLASRRTIEVPVPVAKQHAEPGFYAGGYRVAYDPETRRHRVSLVGLEWRR